MEASPLLLVVADTASQRRRLTQAVLERCDRRGQPVAVIDLAGDLILSGPQQSLLRYDPEAWADTNWQGLLLALAPWFALLELDAVAGERPCLGAVPGLGTVLRALYLAESWQALQAERALVVVMPSLDQTTEILQLLRRGPELLEGLWSPLLLWWSQTRQRLAQFELVLRLRLPDADSLALSPLWRSRLQDLAQRLHQLVEPVEAVVALTADAEDLPLMQGRVAALALCGLAQPRLWLEGELEPSGCDPFIARWGLPILLGRATPPHPLAFEPWLAQPLRAETCCWLDAPDGCRCRLLLPGLVREGLRVRQVEGQLLIRSGGVQLDVPLPRARAQLTCRSARIDSPWLEIGLS